VKIYCIHCKKLVGEIEPGSKIRKGTVYLCAACSHTNDDRVLDFLKNTFGIRG